MCLSCNELVRMSAVTMICIDYICTNAAQSKVLTWQSCCLCSQTKLDPRWASHWLAGWCFSFLYRTGSLCHGIHCVPGSALKLRTPPWWGSEVRRMASFVSPKKPRPLSRSPPPQPGRGAKWVKAGRWRTLVMSYVCAETPHLPVAPVDFYVSS